jgi:hypothetical protein
MPQGIIDFLSNQWTITIGGTVIAAGIIAAVAPLRRGAGRFVHWIGRGLKRLGAWLKPSGLNRPVPEASSVRTESTLPPFVIAPRWDIRGRQEDSRIHVIQNVGGLALHVRVRPESDETVVEGDLDRERLDRGERIAFRVLNIDREMSDTWFQIDCRDSAGTPQPTARVRIPGMISNML